MGRPLPPPPTLDCDRQAPALHTDPYPQIQKMEVFGTSGSLLLQPQEGSRILDPLSVSPETDGQMRR